MKPTWAGLAVALALALLPACKSSETRAPAGGGGDVEQLDTGGGGGGGGDVTSPAPSSAHPPGVSIAPAAVQASSSKYKLVGTVSPAGGATQSSAHKAQSGLVGGAAKQEK